MGPRIAHMGMIVPTTWQNGTNYIPFRDVNFVQGSLTPSILINLPFDVFPDAYVDTCIAIFSKATRNTFSIFAYDKKTKIKQVALDSSDFHTISMSQLKDEPFHRIFTKSADYPLFTRLSGPNCTNLGTITDSCQGPVESFFEYSNFAEDESYLPYAVCEVDRYELEIIQRNFIRFGTKNLLRKFYTQPRILIRRIVNRRDRLMAVIAMEPFVVRKDLNPFILRDDGSYDLRFLLANINSTLHSYVYTESSTAAGKDDFRQTTLTALEALPIRRINFITPQEQRDLYRQKAVELYEYCIDHDEDEEFTPMMGFVETHLEAQPEETDVVHDLLAVLSEQMLRLHEIRREEQKKVLKWLEQQLRIQGHKMGIEVLEQGTSIANFVGYYQLKGSELQLDRLLWVLDLPKNKRRYGDSFSNRKADISERYQISLAKVSEINKKLRVTDKLIDKVIYMLYGLTSNEIKMVES